MQSHFICSALRYLETWWTCFGMWTKHSSPDLSSTPHTSLAHKKGTCTMLQCKPGSSACTAEPMRPPTSHNSQVYVSTLPSQVLHMLRGSPSPGRALTLNPNLDAYEVTAGAHVAHLSPGCLHNMLTRFCRPGTTSYRCSIMTTLKNFDLSAQLAAMCMPSAVLNPGHPTCAG